MKRVALIGYYGRDNLGDDLMLAALARRLAVSVPHLQLDVSTAAPLSFSLPECARVIVTPSWRGRLAKLGAIVNSDAVIWGGGTCIYEDGPGGLAGLRGLRRVLELCRLSRTRFILLGVGLGELHTSPGRELARRIITGADAVYCRDETSRERADRLAGTSCASTGGDLAFLDPAPIRRAGDTESSGMPATVAFCGASYFADDDAVVSAYRGMIATWLEAGVGRVRFIPMHRGRQSDHAMHRRLAADLPEDRVELLTESSTDDALRALATADAAVSFRLHGVALADMIGLPCWAVAYSPKVSYYCRKIGEVGSRRLRELGAAITPADLAAVREDRFLYRGDFEAFVAAESRAASDSVADACQRFLSA